MLLKFNSGECVVKNMIICLVSVYGNGRNYVNPNMLDEGFVSNEIQNGSLNVFSGTTETGEAVVTASVKRNPHFLKSLEVCTLAVNEAYRGFHYGSEIIKYILNGYKNAPLFYAHVVMFKPLAGEAFENNGFVPTGFLFGVCDAKKHLSQLNYISQKHSWSVFVKNNGRTTIDTIYLPERLNGFTKKIYASLKVSPVIENRIYRLEGLSLIESEYDEYHKTLYFYVIRCGIDLLEKIKAIEQHRNDVLQTNIIFLNINDSNAAKGYNILEKSGYVFAGLKPLCGDYEFIIMSKTEDAVLDFSELKMTPSIKSIFEKVRNISKEGEV